MYGRTPLIPKLADKVSALVESLDLNVPGMVSALDQIERNNAEGKWVHHSINIPASDDDGRELFLRVLAWQDRELAAIRTEGIRAQAAVASQIDLESCTFSVPHIYRSSLDLPGSELVWDIQSLEAGVQLPCEMEVPGRLSDHLEHVHLFIETMDAIARISVAGVQRQNWREFEENTGLIFRWAGDERYLDQDVVETLMEKRADLLQRFASEPGTLCHPDLHTANAIIKPDSLVVFDWDGTVLADSASMYARHWVILSHEREWQAEFLRQLSNRNPGPTFWNDFLVTAAFRGLDQCHFELVRRNIQPLSLPELRARDAVKAGVVDRMIESVVTLDQFVASTR